MQEHLFSSPDGMRTVLVETQTTVFPRQLLGMSCSGDEGPIRTRGPATLITSLGRFEAESFQKALAVFDETSARMAWTVGESGLRWESVWSFCPRTGVISRKDRLANASPRAVTIHRCQARLAFPAGCHEVYSHDSRWCRENQGEWAPLRTGETVLTCEWGRTTQGGTPYAALREAGSDQAIAFHILPVGNWAIRFSGHAFGPPAIAVVELGPASEDLRLVLAPGAALELPEILLQAVPEGEVHLAAPALHRFALEHFFSGAKSEPPVVYNTWFDQFDALEVPRMREQLAVAREIGCEVFVIDAGWYGQGQGGWGVQAGDWREKLDGAFAGRMREFADEVRAAGLGFGLWMEPERLGAAAPIRAEQPQWFVPVDGHTARVDLENPQARAWMRSEIARLIETYGLAWLKIDFNFELGPDATGQELAGYYRAWYGLLDELRHAYPTTFFEGCASGGMRSDLHSVSHFDGHFLSDNVNPVDVLRIGQGALLRLPPGRVLKWIVLRGIGQSLCEYGQSTAQSAPALVTPGGAGWTLAEAVQMDFAFLATLPAVMGLSGDLISLAPQQRLRLSQHVAFFKQWRQYLSASVAHLLTPPRPMGDHSGWIALQLAHPQDRRGVVLAYRLRDSRAKQVFRLRELEPDTLYTLEPVLGGSPTTARGSDLMQQGIPIDLPGPGTAAAIILRPT